ncbi:MAG: TetR family transcriptional regulator [Rhodospirillales bacterium]|nr:TetR family transcriptional regulator [Rhodospirillales bacterium]
MDNEERRGAIVAAAVPLFARKGFAGTTTKEIAEAATVSEALVFKHFPSKAALYEEILHQGCRGDPGFEHLVNVEPSTGNLIDLVHFMMHHSLERAGDEMSTRHRLMVRSFIEDGEYARLVCEWMVEKIYPKIADCLRAAQAAGDLLEQPGGFENPFWFAHHVAAMVAYARLPGASVVPYRGNVAEVIAEAARFVLRGLGVKDSVLAAHRVKDFTRHSAAAE